MVFKLVLSLLLSPSIKRDDDAHIMTTKFAQLFLKASWYYYCKKGLIVSFKKFVRTFFKRGCFPIQFLLIKVSFQMLIKSKCCDKMPLESSTLQIAAWREISKEFQNQALSITVTLWQTTKMHNNKFSLFPLKQCQPFLSDLSLKKKSLYTRLFILLCFFFLQKQ